MPRATRWLPLVPLFLCLAGLYAVASPRAMAGYANPKFVYEHTNAEDMSCDRNRAGADAQRVLFWQILGTGEDARRVGLVDALGGYQEALQLARQSIGLTAGAPIERVRYPRALDSLDAFLDALTEGKIGTVLTSLQSIAMFTSWISRLTSHGRSGLVRSEALVVPRVSR